MHEWLFQNGAEWLADDNEGALRGDTLIFEAMLVYAKELADQPAQIDYFATSLPTMLLFEEDLDARQSAEAALLRDLALTGLDATDKSESSEQRLPLPTPRNEWKTEVAFPIRTQERSPRELGG